MLQSFGDTYSLRGIKNEHSLQQIKSQGIRVRVKGGERHSRSVRQRLDELASFRVVDEPDIGVAHGAEHIDDEPELAEAVGAGEDGLPAEKLGEDAADRPDVDRGSVFVAAEKELGGSVPAGDDVLGHELVFAGAGAS